MTDYLTITPHDPIIARDGRPFGIGQGIRMKSLNWPYPSVLAGSLRTLLGKLSGDNFEQEGTAEALKKITVAGPFPLLNEQIFLPAPKDILIREDGTKREAFSIRPMKPEPGCDCDLPECGLLPSMLPKRIDEEFKPANIPSFWSCDMIAKWLCNATGDGFNAPPDLEAEKKRSSPCQKPKRTKKDLQKINFLSSPKEDSRFHAKIDYSLGSSEDGMLFETIGLDLSQKGRIDGMKLAAMVETELTTQTSNEVKELIKKYGRKVSEIDSFGFLGGERRLSHWKASDMAHNGWEIHPELEKALSNETKRIRLVLATPAIFDNGWFPGWLKPCDGHLEGKPPGIPDELNLRLILVSACTERWKPISGWSLENWGAKNGRNGPKPGPKPIRRLVPSGSVYFFEIEGDGDAATLAKSLWLKSVCDHDQDRRDGFGLAIWGIWDYAIETEKEQKQEV
jgi:CRISPR-associated protein Cmr3